MEIIELKQGPAVSKEQVAEISRSLLSFDIDSLAEIMLELPQADVRLRHIFGPGTYAREMFAPAGTIVVGRIHKEACINVCSAGSAVVRVDDKVFFVQAPATFVSAPGSRKLVYVIDDLVWTNLHNTDTQEIERIEERLYVNHQKEKPLCLAL